MREIFLFEWIEKTRNHVLAAARDFPKEKASLIPQGFNNNFIWNLGHILLATKVLAFDFTGHSYSLPDIYTDLFYKGTKPADWKVEPPVIESMLSLLEEQLGVMLSVFPGKLDLPVQENFMNGKTVGDMLLANLLHENTHLATIQSLQKFLNH